MASRRVMSVAASSSASSSSAFTTALLPSRSGNLGIIELNNPASLNALTLPMVRSLNVILPAWHSDPTLRATLFVGSPGKNGKPVFCAGGDVKSVYMDGVGVRGVVVGGGKDEVATRQRQHGFGERGLLTADYFREEYIMNHRIATQEHGYRPQVSIWNGVVMGGGVGISVHGRYRVATENTVFAMPETAIGLFPDVGGTWWLPRLKGGMGSFIALTGIRLRSDDLMFAGLATHYIPEERLGDLRELLVEATKEADGDEDCAASVLMSLHENIPKDNCFLAKHQDEIDAAFGGNNRTVEDIMASLETLASSGSKFGADVLDTLGRVSPTSLKVTHEGLRRGLVANSVAEALRTEYRMAQGFMRNGSDFYEGTRALLVDKDKDAKWNPKGLEAVTDEFVSSFFDSLGENDLDLDGQSSSKL